MCGCGISILVLLWWQNNYKLNISSPYTSTPPAICYPGDPVDEDIAEVAKQVIKTNTNSIGTHTHGFTAEKQFIDSGEGGFEMVHTMEREYIWWIASKFCKHDPKNVASIVDGYICGGGTEGNEQGMWIARNQLQYVNPTSKIAVLYSKLSHYSLAKSCDMLGLNNLYAINYDNNFEVNVNEMKDKITGLISSGFSNFIVFATVGTTCTGSVDNITAISDMLEKFEDNSNIHTYLHVDASFGGFTLPFLTNNIKIGFENKMVKSVVIDGHKMGKLPYPGGIFLCRKDLQHYIEIEVPYINGHSDDTVSGSRSSLGAVLGYYYMRTRGTNGHTDYVTKCIDYRNKLIECILYKNMPYVTILPFSDWTNQLPLVIDIIDGKIPDNELTNKIMENYQMRSDHLEVEGKIMTVYKLVIMPHTFNFIEQFVDDIDKIYKMTH